MTEGCQEKLAMAMSTLESYLHQILDGSICLKNLQVVLDNEMNFVELYRIMSSSSEDHIVPKSGHEGIDQKQVLIKVLHWRTVELQSFQKHIVLCKTLAAMCGEISTGRFTNIYTH